MTKDAEQSKQELMHSPDRIMRLERDELSTTQAMVARPRPLQALTGIRGAAALSVIVFHVARGIYHQSLVPGLLNFPPVRDGFRGVDLFFILSGFIMIHVHRKDFRVITWPSVRHFAALRVLRIYPANFVTLLFIALIVAALPAYASWYRAWTDFNGKHAYTALSFIQTATLSSRWCFPDYGMWNTVTWSLSVELLAYLTLPPLAFLLSRVNKAWICVALAVGSLGLMIGILLHFHASDGDAVTRLGLARGFGGFIAGAAIRRYVDLRPLRGSAPAMGVNVSTAGIVLLLLFPRAGILIPFLFLSLIVSLSYSQGLVNAILQSSPLMFFGRISYSMYLVHYTPLLVLEWLFDTDRVRYTTGNAALGLVGYAALVVILSVVLHNGVEKPCQKFARFVLPARTWNDRASMAPAQASLGL
jgi:peptidoglycan/LPS O-acetylase OafA/YrhL